MSQPLPAVTTTASPASTASAGDDAVDVATAPLSDGVIDVAATPPGDSAFDVATVPPSDSPTAREFIETLTRVVLEVLAGVRDIDQIARWVSDDVYKNLGQRVIRSSRARQLAGQRILRPTFCIGRTLLSEPRAGVIEGVVIVHGKVRTRAVALRLERLGSRWRASAITVL